MPEAAVVSGNKMLLSGDEANLYPCDLSWVRIPLWVVVKLHSLSSALAMLYSRSHYEDLCDILHCT